MKYLAPIVFFIVISQDFLFAGQLIDDSNDSIQSNIKLTSGKLENGLRYFIKSLPDSQDKVEIVLYVKAGANYQESDQLEFAHFVEHMAFKSLPNFPSGIFNAQEKWKMLNMTQFDINGAVEKDHTQYTFLAPPGNKEALETALLWFKDIATNIHFKEEEVDRERSVLAQELITRSADNIEQVTALNNIRAGLFPCYQKTPDIIKHLNTFERSRLIKFYQDWYRPDRMAIVVVGKVEDVKDLETEIKNKLSDLKKPVNSKQIPDCASMYLAQPPQFVSVSLENAKASNHVTSEFYFRLGPSVSNSLELSQRRIFWDLMVNLINRRLRERSEEYNNNYKSSIRYNSDPSSLLLTINSFGGNEKVAIQESFLSVRQFEEHGVSESEYEDAKKAFLKRFHEADLRSHHYWREEIKKLFLQGEPPSSGKLVRLREWLEKFDFNQFHGQLKKLNLRMPEDIGILASPGSPALSFTESEMRSWITNFQKIPVPKYSPPFIPESLMTAEESQDLRIKDSDYESIKENGVHEIELDNGIRVILKSFLPTPDRNQKKIMVHGFTKIGALNFPEEDYFSSINAPGIIKNSGIGKYNKFELQRFTSGTSLSWALFDIYIDNKESGVKVDGGIEDLEEMFQLIYLSLSQPRKDSAAFEDWKKLQLSYYDHHGVDFKQTDLNNEIAKIIGDNSVTTTGSARYEGLDKTDFKRSIEIYDRIFSTTEDFTFIISGDYKMDMVIPLIKKYLGNLPYKKKYPQFWEVANMRSIARPSGPLLVELKLPKNSGKNNYLYKAYFIVPVKSHVHWKDLLLAQVIGKLLDFQVWGLRFEKGFSLYSLKGFGTYDPDQLNLKFSVSLECSPTEYSNLRQEFLKILDRMKAGTISDDFFRQGLIELKSRYSPNGRAGSNKTILYHLYNQYRFGFNWPEKNDVLTFLESLTVGDVQEVIPSYFKDEHFYEFVIKN